MFLQERRVQAATSADRSCATSSDLTRSPRVAPYRMSLDCDEDTPSLVNVLPLVLQHSRISSAVRSMCSLLCTCQQAAQAVEQHCIGKIQLRAQHPAAMTWFKKHWRLVKAIHMLSGPRNSALLEASEEGLVAAAAARCE